MSPWSRRGGFGLVALLALTAASSVATSEASAPGDPAALADQPSAPAVVRGNDWLLRRSLSAGAADVSFRFGLPTDQPLFGDWDGDGAATPGLFRNGDWLLRDKLWGGSVDRTVSFGLPGDIPVVGDWDGDGDDDIAAYRAGQWLFDMGLTGGDPERAQWFGLPTDTPMAGDWDGAADSSVADRPGLRRGSRWYLATSDIVGGHQGVSFSYGPAGDAPVVGRWQDGPGADQVGVVDGADWNLRHAHSGGPADAAFSYGQSDDFFLTWGGSPQSTAQPARHFTYKVGVKGNVTSSIEQFADLARQTLNDQRGWSLGRLIRFSRVHSGTADMNLWLATPAQVAAADPVCDEEWSCRVGKNVYVNLKRWNQGTDSWSSRPLSEYRQYIFNHEVGHWLSQRHTSCSARGAAAPVMMQQSISLNGCEVNLWPLRWEKQRVYDLHVAAAAGDSVVRAPARWRPAAPSPPRGVAAE